MQTETILKGILWRPVFMTPLFPPTSQGRQLNNFGTRLRWKTGSIERWSKESHWLNQSRCPQPHGEGTAPSCQPCSVHCLQRDLPYSAKLQPRLDTRRRELTSSNHALTMSRNLRDLSLPSMRSPICHPLHSWPLGEEWLPLIPTTCKGAKGIPKGGDLGRSRYIQTNIRVAWDYLNGLINRIMWFTLKQS